MSNTMCGSGSRAILPLAILVVLVAGLHGQQLSRPEAEQRLVLLRESAARNLRSLARYSWQQRVEFLSKGKVRSFRIEEVHFAPDGTLQRHRVGGGGKNVSNGKARQLTSYMDRMVSLAGRYMYPSERRLLAAFDAGHLTITQRPDSGRAEVRVRDYFKAGDSLEMSFDTIRKRIRELRAHSYLDRKEGVEISMEFQPLPDGTNYPATTSIALPAKKIELRIQAKGHRLVR